ncbi:MAG: formyltransferase family protein [Ardenticatenaceae bacterium]
MKFLMLGYSPYLPELISALRGSQFLANHQIDITIPVVKLKVPKKLFSVAKKRLTTDEFEKFLVDFERYYGPEQRQELLRQAFPDVSLSFLSEYASVRLKSYRGLESESLADYDYMIVASFGQKIPREIFAAPKYGTLNVHPSFLPNLRGGYPTYIQAFDPTQRRGTTIHQMSEGFDEGQIVIQKEYDTAPHLSNSQLLSLSAHCAAELLETLHQSGFQFTPIKQEQAQATECRKLLKRKHDVGQMKSALAGFVRANHDRYLFPYTYTFLAGELFMILDVQPVPANPLPISNWPDRQIRENEGRYYIKFGPQVYLICQYIFRGQFHQPEKHVPRKD